METVVVVKQAPSGIQTQVSMPVVCSRQLWVRLAVLAIVLSACGRGPQADDGAQDVLTQTPVNAPPAQPTLKAIMQVLASDMAGVAMGVWLEQPDVVQDAARRVADHPRVPAEQLQAIQATLNQEFADFARHDQQVHDTSLDLIAAVDASASPAEWLGIVVRIQEGCVACHSAYRSRLVPVLNPSGNGQAES